MMRLRSGCASTAKLLKRRSRKEQELQASRSFPLPRRKSRLHRPRRPSLRLSLRPGTATSSASPPQAPAAAPAPAPRPVPAPAPRPAPPARPRVPPVHRCNVQCRRHAPPQQPAYRPQQPGYPGAQQPPAYRPPGPGYAPPPAERWHLHKAMRQLVSTVTVHRLRPAPRSPCTTGAWISARTARR
jgi:hypothetical protein